MATPRPAPSTAPAPRPAGAKSRLGAVARGQLRSALRYMFYGPEGVGKSSLLANVPGILLFDIEGGSDNIDVPRYTFRDGEGGHVPRTYEDVSNGLEDMIANPGHGFAAVGIDTADALEALIHAHVCKVHGHESIEAFGFGKGYNVALDEGRRFVALLDRLRATGVSVVLTAHSIVKTFKNPEGEDYDRYQLRMNDKLAGLLKDQCDVVGFVNFEGGGSKMKGDKSASARARGWATGRRVVHLAREAAWDAKSRLSLPAEVVLAADHPWAPFAEASKREYTAESLRQDVDSELVRIAISEFVVDGKSVTAESVRQYVATAPASSISRILAGLRDVPAHALPPITKES